MTKLLFSSILLISAAPAVAQNVDSIDQVRTEWVKSWNGKQLDALMALYANDSVLLPATGERVVGKDKIRAYFKALFDSSATLRIALSNQNYDTSGELAYDSGSYDETITRPGTTISGAVAISGAVSIAGGGGQRKTAGSYLVILRRQAGKLFIVQQALTEKAQPQGQ